MTLFALEQWSLSRAFQPSLCRVVDCDSNSGSIEFSEVAFNLPYAGWLIVTWGWCGFGCCRSAFNLPYAGWLIVTPRPGFRGLQNLLSTFPMQGG